MNLLQKIAIAISVLGLALFFSSCSHNPYWTTPDGKFVHQCDLPVSFGIHSEVDSGYVLPIIRGVNYWGDVIGKPSYFYVGRVAWTLEELPSSVLMVSVLEDYDREGCGIAVLVWDPGNGCIKKTLILLSKDCIERHSLEWLETIVRHEAGHALGLRHSDRPGELMFPKLLKKYVNPVDASEKEKENMRNLYREER